MKRTIRYAVLLAAIFSVALPVLGLPPLNLTAGYTRRLWRAQDGLPDQTVQAIAQTPDGYLWIGTKGGLLRFDGARFVVYDHTNTPGLSESSINCLSVSRDGSLWIGTEGGGLVRYRDQVFRTYPTAEGSSDSFVRVIFEDHRGVIWIGGDQGLFQVEDATLKHIDGIGQVPSVFVRAIVEDGEDNVWVGGTTLLRFDGQAVREYPLPGGPSFNLITSMLVARDGTFWMGTLSGLHTLLRSGALRRVDAVLGTVQTLREISDSSVWIGTLGGGAFVEHNGALSALSAPDFLPSNTVLALFEDSEHNLWLGTQAGLLRLSRSLVAITPFPGASDSQFETVYQDRDSSVWAASTHLFHIRNGVITRATFPAIPNVRVRTLMRDRKGEWWIGTDGAGLYHLTDDHAIRYISPAVANDFIRVILQARDGSLWVGTDGGLSHLAAAGITNYNTPNGLSYFSVTALLEDHLGDIWVGTSRGLSHLHRGAFVNDNVTARLKHEKIWSIHEDPDNGLWFGTSNGLYSLRAGTLALCTTAQGLAGNVIYQILEDGSSHLWLSGPNNVSRVDRHAIESALEPGTHPRISLTLYPISQDFDSAELYGGMQPAGFISPQHEVWFPSNEGPVHIQIPPKSPLSHPSFPVVINRVAADGRELAVQPQVVIAPGHGSLEISFAAILLRSQEALRYRYKLEGFDHDWNEAWSRRTAYYTNLPPGRYRFRVEAYEVNNPSVVSEAAIEVDQQPHFYRTLGFFLACLCALLAAVFAIHRYRLRQVSMRFHAVIEERNRMAREMHDTVIQDCVGLSTLLEAVSSLDFTDKALSHELVDHAREQVVTTIDEARIAVWNLRHSDTRIEDIGVLVRGIAEQMHDRFGQPIACSVVGSAFPLSDRITHELVMIVREALWNAHAHAYSTRIEVRVAFTGDHLAIDVQDDGVGFDSAAVSDESELHYGLIGMRERAQRLGGELCIETSAGKGTVVRILLPRSVREATNAVQTVDHG
jgi:ligand-binding sensor domain-containing protein/signal transduction histidine kinase